MRKSPSFAVSNSRTPSIRRNTASVTLTSRRRKSPPIERIADKGAIPLLQDSENSGEVKAAMELARALSPSASYTHYHDCSRLLHCVGSPRCMRCTL
jgi:hypothetical protein